jgi:hypothetical protein
MRTEARPLGQTIRHADDGNGNLTERIDPLNQRFRISRSNRGCPSIVVPRKLRSIQSVRRPWMVGSRIKHASA